MQMKKKIVLQGIPFCFGPAAHMIAIGNELRKKYTNKVELIALADGTVFELITKTNLFDKIYRFKTKKSCINQKIFDLLSSANKIISVGDFEFVRYVVESGLTLSLVDPLLWMWKEVPEEIKNCDLYFAVDFPGVRKRIMSLKTKYDGNTNIKLVDQICSIDEKQYDQLENDQSIIVHFGGISNPLGTNIELVTAMIQDILDVLEQMDNINSIKVRGGDKILRKILRNIKIPPSKKSIEFGSVNQNVFFNELSKCKAILSVPGMSIVYESFTLNKPILFLLPLNYSQLRQMYLYKIIFKQPSSIQWEDLNNYYSIGNNEEEKKAINELIKMSKKYFKDYEARNDFKILIKNYLVDNKITALLKNKNSDVSYTTHLNGAQQIIEHMFK